MPRITLAEEHDRFAAQLAAAASASDADQRLAAMLETPGADKFRQILVAAALGDVPAGQAGSNALRNVFEKATSNFAQASKTAMSQYRDLISACVAALAKRDGPAATDVYVAATRSPNPTVRDYGLSALAVAGDDRAWGELAASLNEVLQKKISLRGWRWRQACREIEYLARHSAQASDNATRLIGLLRHQWQNLADPNLISRWWPGIEPGGQAIEALDLAGQHVPQLWWREPYM